MKSIRINVQLNLLTGLGNSLSISSSAHSGSRVSKDFSKVLWQHFNNKNYKAFLDMIKVIKYGVPISYVSYKLKQLIINKVSHLKNFLFYIP